MWGKGMNKESKHGVAMSNPLSGKKINPLFRTYCLLLFYLTAPLPAYALESSNSGVVKAAQHSSQTNNSPRELVVSMNKKGLLSLKAVNIELNEVLTALSKASAVPIKLMDQVESKTKITISFQDMTIQAAVTKVMSTLPAGGFASAGGENGTTQVIYVATRKGADRFQKKSKEMIDRINKGEKPTHAEIKAWLLDVAAYGFPIDPAGTSTLILPVLLLMDGNYGAYGQLASSLYQDKSVTSPLRSAMLELLGRHWDDPASRNSLITVFNGSGDDVVLQGQTSLTLARHGVAEIGDKVIQQYPTVSPEARFYYAQTLAALGRNDAVALLQEDAKQTQNMPLRAASITALIKLEPLSTETSSLFSEIIHSAKPVPTVERSATDLSNESVAMHAVEAVGQTDNAETNNKLLLIANDESVAVDVRLTALESLVARASTMPMPKKIELNVQVTELKQRITESKLLNEMNKERMFGRIKILQNMIAPPKGE